MNNDLLITPNAGLGKTFDFLHLWEMLKRALYGKYWTLPNSCPNVLWHWTSTVGASLISVGSWFQSRIARGKNKFMWCFVFEWGIRNLLFGVVVRRLWSTLTCLLCSLCSIVRLAWFLREMKTTVWAKWIHTNTMHYVTSANLDLLFNGILNEYFRHFTIFYHLQ